MCRSRMRPLEQRPRAVADRSEPIINEWGTEYFRGGWASWLGHQQDSEE